MTDGQQQALRELNRLTRSRPDEFELSAEPRYTDNGLLVARVAIRIGHLETREGGLDLREREEFSLVVPADYPFDRPSLVVLHERFAGFPHVTWGSNLCLYQSKNEWNPSDGLYGFFDRLNLWLTKAAINDMDPVEGPLEPPHHVTAFSQKPFVIRADAPCPAGDRWMGFALLDDHANRTDLLGWIRLGDKRPRTARLAVAVMLPGALPNEFPKKGADLFPALEKAGLDKDAFIDLAALAALFAPEGEPVHFVFGFPMRRAADGSNRVHIAVWTSSADNAKTLRLSLPQDTDTDDVKSLRGELRENFLKILELATLAWCQILEDREEIIQRRDRDTPVQWFRRKTVLILGCGALGSWAAEIVVRAGALALKLADNEIVKPGVLTRQNFTADDIGSNKAKALAARIQSITPRCSVTHFAGDAYAFLVANIECLREFDLILDCTASTIFQMKLERDQPIFRGRLPSMLSMVIDASARHCICVVRSQPDSGVWGAYLSLKKALCVDGLRRELISAFYTDRTAEPVFQPEPGCSDPTFVGSTADVLGLLTPTLNSACELLLAGANGGISVTSQRTDRLPCTIEVISPIEFVEVPAGQYRVFIAKSVFAQARGWVRQSARARGRNLETGGLLWGIWESALRTIWIFDASGPPPDSQHSPEEFICGTAGTEAEHNQRMKRTFGTTGFVGHWHTHPNVPSQQSATDMRNMSQLVSVIGGNQSRSLMLIFGRTDFRPTAGVYVYESAAVLDKGDLISVGSAQILLKEAVV